MDTYASLYSLTRSTNSTFQCHSPRELVSKALRLLDVVAVHLSGRNSENFGLNFPSVVIRFHGQVNSTYSITPILEITQDRQQKRIYNLLRH